jgi:predicted amidophosphoribosyltransferase
LCDGAQHATRPDGRRSQFIRLFVRTALDFALPPRCAGCETIVDEVHGFCAQCWTSVEFLGESGCECCGLPLEATEQKTCAR